MIYRKFGKRLFDIVASLLALLVLSPLFLIIAVLVRVKLGHPVIFKQQRPGKNEKIFTIYKFRTMTEEKDSEGKLLPDSERLTGFGKWLRSTSIDELPELINILRGDMSVVGPRPLLVEYLPLYDVQQRRRHEVKPGLSGLAQVKGRNELSWEDKFVLDVQYVDTFSFYMDILIILQTLLRVGKRQGISSKSAETMEAFSGQKKIIGQ